MFGRHEHTVRATLRRWENDGLGGLWEAPGRGAKAKWQPADLEHLTDCLAQEQRTYNSVQLAQKLKQERLVDLSSDRLRCLLQKKDIGGNAPGTAIESNKTRCKERSSKPI